MKHLKKVWHTSITQHRDPFKKVAPTQPPRFRNFPPILQQPHDQSEDPDIGPPQPTAAAGQQPGPLVGAADQQPHAAQPAAEHPPAPLGEEAQAGLAPPSKKTPST